MSKIYTSRRTPSPEEFLLISNYWLTTWGKVSLQRRSEGAVNFWWGREHFDSPSFITRISSDHSQPLSQDAKSLFAGLYFGKCSQSGQWD